MRKTTVLIALIIMALLWLKPVASQFYIGAQAGINSSKFSGDIIDKASYVRSTGANFGLIIDYYAWNESVAFSLQPSFSQDGTALTYKLKGYDKPRDTAKFNMNYFSIPLIIKVMSTNKKWYGLTGIETAYLNNGVQMKLEGGEKETITEGINEFNLNLHFGFGFRLNSNKARLFLEARYYQGLTNITNEPVNENDFIPRIKTTGLRILFGVEVPLSNLKNE